MSEPDGGTVPIRRRPLPDRLDRLAEALDTAHPRHEVAIALRATAEELRADPFVSDAARSVATQLAVQLHVARITAGYTTLSGVTHPGDMEKAVIYTANRLITYLRTGE